ncbi:hypothetical protein MMC13_005072 [Lambiella insularis]|nr:hypothetical protein [Lambiella insularis]
MPIINEYPNDINRAKAKQQFISDAQGLLEKGTKIYPDQPFRIITALSDRVFLPYTWIDWLRKHPDLDHQAAVAQDFFGDYPGFEAIGAFNDPNHFVIDLVKKRMSQITQVMLDTFESQADKILKDNVGDGTTFHDISWGTLCFNMTASVASAVFSGPTLAHDAEWQTLITSHTRSLFDAARALRSWPPYLRPIVHRFLPDCRASRAQLAQARRKLASYELQDNDQNSVFAWTKHHQSPDAAVIQLALAAGAIHTSSQLLQQTVLDLALASTQQPKVIDDLRGEIESVFGESNGKLVPTSVAKLTFLDACIKETQRLKPQTLNNLERVAIKDVKLPSGQVIPKGTQVALPSSPMWSEDQWGADADKWNPYRYMKIDEKMSLVSSNDKHYAFGMGRFICPGRFFVAAEIKVVLVKILMKYDLRIDPKQLESAVGKKGRVEWKAFGFEQLADGDVTVEAQRRKER